MLARPPSRLARLCVLLAFQVLALGIGFLSFELAHRLWLRARGQAYDAGVAREALLRAQDQVRSFVPKVDLGIEMPPDINEFAVRTHHPYTGWEMVGGYMQVDRDLEELRSRTKDEVYEVLIVGGSVSAMFGETGTKRLSELLSADPRFAGREIRYFNYGRGAFKQPQQAHFVLYLLSLGFRPDAVLLIDGFNEVALGNANGDFGASPVFPSIECWLHLSCGASADRSEIDEIVAVRTSQQAVESQCERALRLGLYRSSVLGTLALSRVAEARTRGNEAARRYTEKMSARSRSASVRGPRHPGSSLAVVEQAVLAWEHSSRDLQAICRARGIAYLHVLQPTLHDPGAKKATPGEVQSGGALEQWIVGVKTGYPLLRERGAALREEGVAFVDMSRVFANHEGTLYMDSCHFDRQGNKLLAEGIAPAMLAAIASVD